MKSATLAITSANISIDPASSGATSCSARMRAFTSGSRMPRGLLGHREVGERAVRRAGA